MIALAAPLAGVLLRAPAFELGLSPVPSSVDRAAVVALAERGLLEVRVEWRRTPKGERVAEDVACRRVAAFRCRVDESGGLAR